MKTESIDPEYLRPRLLSRELTSHKGDFGHLLIVAGCETMPGAAVLATGAALHSGCGLVTLHSTPRALQAVVNNFPSAMLSEESGPVFSRVPKDLGRYRAIAVGPGLGRAPQTKRALVGLLEAAFAADIPTVLDADALNILSEIPGWEDCIPRNSVLTPHLGELRRLLPGTDDDALDGKVCERCLYTGSTLVLKGYHTKVTSPIGPVSGCITRVNTTGNPGLAKGGSGDVLTGLICGLGARGYAPADAAALGVWLHGLAGDILSESHTPEGYDSRDLIDALPLAFRRLYGD